MSDRWPLSPSEVALDLLDDEQRPVAEQLLAEDPEFARAVEAQRSLTAVLDEMPALMRRPEPPPPLRPITPAAEPARRRRLPSLRITLPTLAAVAAVAVLAVVVSTDEEPAPVQPAVQVALKPIGDVPGSATITVKGERAELVGEGLPPSPKGEHYEAWLARQDGTMKSMGEFRVRADGSVEAGMEFREDLGDYKFVDVSVEEDNGPPEHSGKSVLRADL